MVLIAKDLTNVQRSVLCDSQGRLIVTLASSIDNMATNFYKGGIATLNKYIVQKFKFETPAKVKKIGIDAEEAPDTVAFQVTLMKNSGSTSQIATLAAGSLAQETTITAQTFQVTEELGIKVTQVGNFDTPTDIQVAIHYEKTV